MLLSMSSLEEVGFKLAAGLFLRTCFDMWYELLHWKQYLPDITYESTCFDPATVVDNATITNR